MINIVLPDSKGNGIKPGTVHSRQHEQRHWELQLLTALFKKLKVYVHEESVSVISARTGVNMALRELYGQHLATRPTAASEGPENAKTSRDMAGGSLQVGSGSSSFIHGLSKNQLAGVPGLEPRTTEPESAVLPITPYPTVPTRGGARGSARRRTE
ncbi:uncharacterized protein MalAC0309_0926 [Microcella alkaliphila]|uniref:Uncharacterized protein n=1 Tax=Microcella alkaliphila TaxID=279828 RepID=A0A0U5B7G2_9MICO|nr:uncharacterized protein MalAC0309_0926 [Microcella alkaliphila]